MAPQRYNQLMQRHRVRVRACAIECASSRASSCRASSSCSTHQASGHSCTDKAYIDVATTAGPATAPERIRAERQQQTIVMSLLPLSPLVSLDLLLSLMMSWRYVRQENALQLAVPTSQAMGLFVEIKT
jgi:hypothetical protein